MAAITARLGPNSPGTQAKCAARPTAQQQVQRILATGGEHDVVGGHADQHTDRRTARAEDGLGGPRGDVAADLGLVAGVLCGSLDGRVALPGTGRRVQVHAGHRRPGGPPTGRQFVLRDHLTASDNPKSPAGSVHQCVRASPASASSAATPSGVNLHDTSVSISSPSAKSTDRPRSAI